MGGENSNGKSADALLKGMSPFDPRKPYTYGGAVEQDWGSTNYTVKQNNLSYVFRPYSKQDFDASKGTDPTKSFEIKKQFGAQFAVQGEKRFRITDLELQQTGVEAATSPNAKPNQPLARVPRNLRTGSFVGTSASRSLSNSAFNRSKQVGLRQPLLSGY
jgi:hypothetical protein